jgi:hypothetical protein
VKCGLTLGPGSRLTGVVDLRFPPGLGVPYEYRAIREASDADEGLSAGSCFIAACLVVAEFLYRGLVVSGTGMADHRDATNAASTEVLFSSTEVIGTV